MININKDTINIIDEEKVSTQSELIKSVITTTTLANIKHFTRILSTNLLYEHIRSTINEIINGVYVDINIIKYELLKNTFPFKSGKYNKSLKLLYDHIDTILFVDEKLDDQSLFTFKIIINERDDMLYINYPKYDMQEYDYSVSNFENKTMFKKIMWMTNHLDIIPIQIIEEKIHLYSEAHGEERVSHKWSHIKDRLTPRALSTIMCNISFKPKDDLYYFICVSGGAKDSDRKIFLKRDIKS